MTKSTPETAPKTEAFHFPTPVDFSHILKDAEKRGEILQPHGLQKLCDDAASTMASQNYKFLTEHKISLEEAKRRIALRDERYAMAFEPPQAPSAGLDFSTNEDPDYVNSLDDYWKGPDQ